MQRTAIVTGGSNGIGRATVRMMAREGINVLFSYYSDEKARDSLLEETSKAPGKVFAVKADVGSKEGVQAIFEAALEQLGHIDILFNNAGVFLNSTFLKATEENLDRTLDVIVKGTFFLTQKVAEHMIANEIKGRIINTSSAVTKNQENQPLDYCIAKAGINVMTTGLAKELGRYGITVNAVLPGAIPTKINSWQFADSKIRETFRQGSVLGELGDPDYIAAAVMYFISEKARWTTGVLMSVDGGFTL
ncbi:MAG: SDR family oxidoreductase [Lachnospiraceae bacterium]|nr:SDR family oxidoreductase [Lachnospiraceae bacterium]